MNEIQIIANDDVLLDHEAIRCTYSSLTINC
jgi:hypothetical protein